MKIRSTKTIAEALYETAKGKSGAELAHALENGVQFLKKNNLLGRSKEILEQLQEIIDKDENVVSAKVRSAEPLTKKMTDELENNLKVRYKAEKVEIETKEDKSLISGIKIEVGDEILDLTLAQRLHQLQEHLIKN